jgi:phosphate-selective porin
VGGGKNFPVIYPFAQYEYYNSQEKGEGMDVMDARCQVSKWNFGLNWRALPNLVVKADYTTRQIGTAKVFGTGNYNSENEFGIGIAYIGWFFKK